MIDVFSKVFQLRTPDVTKVVSGGSFFSFASSQATYANESSALTISAFFNGVEQIANDIAKLPKSVYIKTEMGRVKDSSNVINYLLSTAPNDLMTAYDFWRVNVLSCILKGDAFSRIMRNPQTGNEVAYQFLEYHKMEVYISGTSLIYKYDGVYIDSHDILHFKGFTLDGLRGVSVIKFAASQLGITLDAQNYAKDVYKDRGLGYGVIESDKAIEATNKRAIEEGFAAKMASKNIFKVPMLDEGMKYKSISITPAESQFLESNKNGVLECCRWLNINPHKIKDLSAGTYSNVYQQSIEHVLDSIMPWAVRMEQEVNRKSFHSQQEKYFKMNINALLRADLAGKKDYYTAMVYAGIMTRNEVRELEELNKIDGLDEPLLPVNMQALSVAMQLINEPNGNSSK